MFNKRETRSSEDQSTDGRNERGDSRSTLDVSPARESRPAASRREDAAVIGPSIHINGDLRGEEDLVIEGEVKGTVHLENNSLTIGSKGKVTADVYAHTIVLEGFMKGDLYASERVQIRKSARMQGNIHSPRVALEDGARFKGSIEMDPESEALKSAFSGKKTSGKNAGKSREDATGGTISSKPENSGKETGEPGSGQKEPARPDPARAGASANRPG